MPVLLTYESATVKKHDKVCDEYVEDLVAEAKGAWQAFKAELPVDFPVTIHFIVLPLEETKTVRDLAHETLLTYQTL